jgi:type IV secretion system protein VirB3
MSEENIPTGFRLPLYRSLTEQILMAGAPKSVIVLNGTVMAFFILSMHFFWIVPLNIVVHFGAIYLTKKDDQLFDCLKVYIHKKNYYCT